MAVRREVLGAAHVDRANANKDSFTEDFQDMITRIAWGGIWTRPGLTRQMRSAVTITAMVAHGHWEELAMHIRAAITNGLSRDEIKEILLQTAIYCGVPSANTAFKTAQQVFHSMDNAQRTCRTPTTRESDKNLMNQAYMYDAVRTPFGKFGGGLAGVRPDDLAAHVIGEAVKRAPELDVERIDEVVFGNANGAGEENRNIARMGTLLAGLPVSIPGTTVNRLCGSSLDAAIIASRQINTGDAELMLVGGAESMSRAPWVLPKTEKPYPAGDMTLVSTTLGWRLVNKAMRPDWTVSLGEATERLREKYGVTREAQDEFSANSHNLAAAAWDEGFYDNLVTPVPGTDLVRDEGIRAGSSAEKLAGLKTVFRTENGTVTAGNASPLSDGASAAWLGSEKRRRAARAWSRWPASPGAARTPTTRSTSATPRWRPRTRPSPRPASAGTRSAPSNSTRRSPRSPWPASTPGASTPPS